MSLVHLSRALYSKEAFFNIMNACEKYKLDISEVDPPEIFRPGFSIVLQTEFERHSEG